MRSKTMPAAMAVLAILLTSIEVHVAAAQEAGGPSLDSTLEMLNLKATPAPMPAFVEQSRKGSKPGDYIPVGIKPKDRSLKPKTPAEVQALTAELDAARAAQLAGKRPMAPARTVKAGAKPSPIQAKTATNR